MTKIPSAAVDLSLFWGRVKTHTLNRPSSSTCCWGSFHLRNLSWLLYAEYLFCLFSMWFKYLWNWPRGMLQGFVLSQCSSMLQRCWMGFSPGLRTGSSGPPTSNWEMFINGLCVPCEAAGFLWDCWDCKLAQIHLWPNNRWCFLIHPFVILTEERHLVIC